MDLRDHEKQAVFSILVRQLEAQEMKAAAEKSLEEAQARLAVAVGIISNVRPALSVFGFDTTAPKFWDAVREAIGREMYSKAFRVARGEEELQKAAHQDEQDDDRGDYNGVQGIEEGSAPKIKEMIIERLRQSGEVGVRAAEIKEFVTAQGVEMHEKTVGMTLYRLSKDNLARREGRIWFLVPESKAGDDLITEGSSEPRYGDSSEF